MILLLIKKQHFILQYQLIKNGKKNKKILVVDDYEVNLILVSEILKKEPYELIFARDGKQAVYEYKKNPDIDIILMDIKMPVLNGIKATEIIRENDKNIIIIAQTAYAMNYEKKKILESGFNDYISKPIISNELRELIKKY